MEQEQLQRIIEAALLAAPQPLTVNQLSDLFGEDEQVTADQVRRALSALVEASAARGVELIEVASGFRYQVRAEVFPWVSRLWQEKPPRYSRALLETLALIAYRQPITRGEIEQIRGVAVNTQIIRTLEDREWIRVIGHRDVPGKPALFGTTRGFLDYFNLKSLDQLPPLGSLQDLPELEPQFEFDAAATSVSAALPESQDVPTASEVALAPAPPPTSPPDISPHSTPPDDVSSPAPEFVHNTDADVATSMTTVSQTGESETMNSPEHNV